MEGTLTAIEGSAFAQTMRRSAWLYPVANVLHVLGVMTFFAAVAAMDIKAVCGSSTAAVRALITRIRPIAITLLVVQSMTGIMLFLPEAQANQGWRVAGAAVGWPSGTTDTRDRRTCGASALCKR